MLKLVSKFAMDILPSVIATIIGAYIVNHYINIRPGQDASATAAAVSSADPKKANPRGASRPAEKSADLGNIPEPGVRAKGISEKAIIDKSAAEKPVEKPADKADRPAETASIPPIAPASAPAETRRHQPREKAARTVPATVPASQPSAPAEPVVAAPNTVAPVETAITPDANDLARAAIDRLRGTGEASPRVQETARETARETVRVPEAPRVVAAPAPVTVPPVQPLPPPILVSTPPAESAAKPLYPPTAGLDDPHRPTPPADIPDPRPPLDLRADAVDSPAQGRTSVAEDVLSAAKSMFHSVLPK
ncbi:hypothetical protein [Bradyrhizobium sp.]|uniref:hypothetical protein n=1 Tax=Bradyrhizobium sp. TaxID=376 RepID=UPI003C73F30F